MRNIFKVVCLFMLMACTVQQKKRVIFFGDSITEQAVQPGGFITRMNESLEKNNLQSKYELIGAGVSSNKIYDLYLRLENDVLSKNPEVVVIFIGVNDVWHKRLLGTGTDADKFETFYNAMLKRMTDKNIKVIICTPAVIGERTDVSNVLDGELNKYCNIIREIAAVHKMPLVDLRKIFTAYDLANNPENKEKGILTTDGVHLNERGNQLVADEMWKLISVQ
ncbi:MAG: GDSL-type esterase/lipase family protein [Ferruginibacter sp.]